MLSINICINNDNPVLIPLEIIQFDDKMEDVWKVQRLWLTPGS